MIKWTVNPKVASSERFSEITSLGCSCWCYKISVLKIGSHNGTDTARVTGVVLFDSESVRRDVRHLPSSPLLPPHARPAHARDRPNRPTRYRPCLLRITNNFQCEVPLLDRPPARSCSSQVPLFIPATRSPAWPRSIFEHPSPAVHRSFGFRI